MLCLEVLRQHAEFLLILKQICYRYLPLHAENPSKDGTNQGGYDVPKTKEELNLALLDASSAGNLNNVKDAIEKGADIDFVGDDLTTALQYAAKNGYLEIVQYLVENGANLEIAEHYRMSMTALHYAADNNQVSISPTFFKCFFVQKCFEQLFFNYSLAL